MERYEYNITDYKVSTLEDLQQYLNMAGNSGWEASILEITPSVNYSKNYTFLLKRKVQPDLFKDED